MHEKLTQKLLSCRNLKKFHCSVCDVQSPFVCHGRNCNPQVLKNPGRKFDGPLDDLIFGFPADEFHPFLQSVVLQSEKDKNLNVYSKYIAYNNFIQAYQNVKLRIYSESEYAEVITVCTRDVILFLTRIPRRYVHKQTLTGLEQF